MSWRKLRFPMFLKFLVGCLTLAAVLIVGGTYVVKSETRMRARGNYLKKSVRRLEGYTERVGRGMTATLELLAFDPELRAGLAGAPSIAPPATAPPATAPPATAPPETAPASTDPVAIAQEMFAHLQSKNGLKPELFAVFTTANRMVWTPPGSPLSEGDLAELAAVEKARGGTVFAHRVQLHRGVPYQVSALPIRAPGSDRIVGGLLAGVKLERYLDEWSEQTDDNPDTRFRPVLIDGGRILAAAWDVAERDELAAVLQPEKFVRVTVGDDSREVIRLKTGDHDFYVDDFKGYDGTDSGKIGKLYMTRGRRDLAGGAGKVPVVEILVGIAASILIASLMAFWITRPIKQFVKQSRDMLAGETDLNHRIVVDSRDETAALAHNINQLFARLHSLATGVQSAAFQVGASSAEISAASREMLGGLKDQTLKIESSTTAVTELSASIQQVAGNAAEATDVAEQSSTAVNSAVQHMQEIRTAVEDAAEKMRELGESSKRIGNIVEVIRQISEQTSMLALNASIEAAHAGEQGRGFAVVADEVSSLARRVGQSAKDIEALIQTVKEQTQAAITSMEHGTSKVENGSQLVTSTLTGLGQLVAVVKDTATAVQEQAMVSDEIARNMDAVRHIATEVLSGSEESVVQAERLHELAFELEESIGGFNLDGSKLGTTRGGGGSPPARTLASRAAGSGPGAPSRALPRSTSTRAAGKSSSNGSPLDAGPEGNG